MPRTSYSNNLAQDDFLLPEDFSARTSSSAAASTVSFMDSSMSPILSAARTTDVAVLPTVSQSRDGAAAKEARRAAALMTTSAEQESAFQTERWTLLEKQFSGSLTKSEEKRLKYIRWHLYRLDDAREGPAMDRLVEAAVKYEKFGHRVQSLLTELDRLAQEPRHAFQGS